MDEKDLEVYDIIGESLIYEIFEKNSTLYRRLISSKNQEKLIEEISEQVALKVNYLFKIYLKNKTKTLQMILDEELEITKHDWKILERTLLKKTEKGEIYHLMCSDGKMRMVRYHPTLRDPLSGNALGKILCETDLD